MTSLDYFWLMNVEGIFGNFDWIPWVSCGMTLTVSERSWEVDVSNVVVSINLLLYKTIIGKIAIWNI